MENSVRTFENLGNLILKRYGLNSSDILLVILGGNKTLGSSFDSECRLKQSYKYRIISGALCMLFGLCVALFYKMYCKICSLFEQVRSTKTTSTCNTLLASSKTFSENKSLSQVHVLYSIFYLCDEILLQRDPSGVFYC